MSFQDKFGKTNIKKGNRNNLNISFDYDTDPDNTYPVLLFTPDMENTDVHYHIDLSLKEARELRRWLRDFLNTKGSGTK